MEDVADNSDRLVDDLIAHGDETAIAARVRAQLDAGADHVLVHPVDTDLTAAVDTLERLAPALREVRGSAIAGRVAPAALGYHARRTCGCASDRVGTLPGVDSAEVSAIHRRIKQAGTLVVDARLRNQPNGPHR